MRIKDNPNLEFFPIPYEDPEWLEFRKSGIGGSEIGVLLGLVDKYSSPAQMFHEKVGTIEVWDGDNEAMFWGRALESQILEKWQYWEGDNKTYLDNYTKGRKIRTFKRVTGFIRNKQWPWLFVSVDGLMDIVGGFRLDTGEPLKEEGILECKTIEDRTASMWEGGIPPYHIAQVNQYLLVLELDYAELIILENGRRMSVIPLTKSDALCKSIISTSKAFWEKRVVPAQAAYFKYTRLKAAGKTEEAEKYDAIIQHLEPGPTPGEAYKQFMSARFNKKVEEMDGTPEMKLWGLRYKSAAECEKYFADVKSLSANNIAKMLADKNVEYAKFGDRGYLRYMKTQGTSVFRIDNRLKVELDEDKFHRVMDEIDLNYVKWKPVKEKPVKISKNKTD